MDTHEKINLLMQMYDYLRNECRYDIVDWSYYDPTSGVAVYYDDFVKIVAEFLDVPVDLVWNSLPKEE